MTQPTWQHDSIMTNGLRLHYVTQGEGPLMLMLHGFPEFWYARTYALTKEPKSGLNVS